MQVRYKIYQVVTHQAGAAYEATLVLLNTAPFNTYDDAKAWLDDEENGERNTPYTILEVLESQ